MFNSEAERRLERTQSHVDKLLHVRNLLSTSFDKYAEQSAVNETHSLSMGDIHAGEWHCWMKTDDFLFGRWTACPKCEGRWNATPDADMNLIVLDGEVEFHTLAGVSNLAPGDGILIPAGSPFFAEWKDSFQTAIFFKRASGRLRVPVVNQLPR